MGVASENCTLISAQGSGQLSDPASWVSPTTPRSACRPESPPTSLASQPSCSHLGVTSKEVPEEQGLGPRDCSKVACGRSATREEGKRDG